MNKNSTNKKPRNMLETGILFKIVGVLLLMMFSGVLGNYVAILATRQIDHNLTKFIMGVVIGFLIGICIGTVWKYIWDILLKFRLTNVHHEK